MKIHHFYAALALLVCATAGSLGAAELTLANKSKIEYVTARVAGNNLELTLAHGKMEFSKEKLSEEARQQFFPDAAATPSATPAASANVPAEPVPAATPEPRDAPAGDPSAASGLVGGVAYWPAPAHANQVLALAELPNWTVQARYASEKAAADLRKAAVEKGLLGSRLWVDVGPVAGVPFADHSVDLIVACSVEATPELIKTWRQALTAHRGRLVLPGKADLKNASLGDATVKTADGWKVVSFPAEPGGDAWSHRLHGPDNNLASQDKLLKPPFMPQWYDLPLHAGFWGTTTVSAGGRIHRILGSVPYAEVETRSLGNGQVLWKRTLAPTTESRYHAPDFLVGRSCMVATGDELLLVDKADILRLDAETGKELARIAGPQEGGQIKCLAVEGDALVVLAGDPEKIKSTTALQSYSDKPNGMALAAYRLKDGAQLWKITEDALVDQRSWAVRGGRLYYNRQGKGVRCREVATGKEIWTSPAGDVLAALAVTTQNTMEAALISMPLIVAGDGVLLCGAKWTKSLAALDSKDGSLLWQTDKLHGGRSLCGMLWENSYFDGESEIDLRTGAVKRPQPLAGDSCGPVLATPELFMGGFGKCATRDKFEVVRQTDIKSPCDTGITVADGIAMSCASGCLCSLPMIGWRAFTQAGSWSPHAAPTAGRLERLDGKPSAPGNGDALDWAMPRHDIARSGASKVAVGVTAKVLWQWKPPVAVKYEPSPAIKGKDALTSSTPELKASGVVAVGDRVWFVDAQGVVRCCAANTGKELWSQTLPNTAMAAPCWWNNRIYAGDADGVVHCFAADTGAALWRYRVAPGERRIRMYGQLRNSWPLIGGVLVSDGAVYAVAGFQQQGGVHAVAIDALTGATRWSQDDAGLGGDKPELGYSNSGLTCIAQDRLWLPTGRSRPGTYELATGKTDIQPDSTFCIRYGDLALALSPKWVLIGGRRSYLTEDLWNLAHNESGFTAFATQPVPDHAAAINVIENTNHGPVWDDDLLVMPTAINADVSGYGTADLIQVLDAQEPVKYQMTTGITRAALMETDTFGRPKTTKPKEPASRWTIPGEPIMGAALSKDAVILAAAKTTGEKDKLVIEGWELVARKRADGAELWRVPLPGQPTHDSLAINRNGTVLVTLRDGSVVAVGK